MSGWGSTMPREAHSAERRVAGSPGAHCATPFAGVPITETRCWRFKKAAQRC
jgi:hypothetical protein